MIIAPLPQDEEDRLLDLYSYDLLDTEAEKDYDDLVELAGKICNCPISILTLVDKERQWFKAKTGLNEAATPRSAAFCAHTILTKGILLVENALEDNRFYDNPLVTGDLNIRFYAGSPVISPSGHPLGSICVIDTKPGTLNEFQLRALEILSGQVTKLLELRTKSRALRKRVTELSKINTAALNSLQLDNDKEEKKITAELHEKIAQKITACSLYVDMAEDNGEFRIKYFQRARQLINEILNEMRLFSNTALPFTPHNIPVKNILADFIEHTKQFYSYVIYYDAEGNANEINIENSIACIRIVEKWLEVLASDISVKIVVINLKITDKIILIITDDGKTRDFKAQETAILQSTIDGNIHPGERVADYSYDSDKGNILSIIFPATNSLIS